VCKHEDDEALARTVYALLMTDMNNPFWGFETVRSVMRRGGPGPTIGLVVLGCVLILIGFAGAPALVVLGAVAIVVGALPLAQRLRDR
jgi:hypothetical protein